MKAEYSMLSKAVHASATSFRMTDKGTVTSLWSSDRIKLGSWKSREKNVIIISLPGYNLRICSNTGRPCSNSPHDAK